MATSEPSLSQLVRRARAWMWDDALPFWGSTGVDGAFGFVEHLSVDGTRSDVAFKRVRVQARQVYVYSHAHLLGHEPGLDIARNGWKFLVANGLRSDGAWVRSTTRTGGVLDATADLYDQAFVLLAIAWWFRASGDESAIALAHRTLDAIECRLAVPGVAGWQSAEDQLDVREQNPHMHMLEAVLALFESTGDERFRTYASRILELFDDVLYDPETATLAEHFTPTWRREPGIRGRIVEPGHHFEWVWLLHQAAKSVSGADARAGDLFEFAASWGSDPVTGAVLNRLLDDGTVYDAGRRTWPQTEAIKAHIARMEVTRTAPNADLSQLISALLDEFLVPGPIPGTWIDQRDEAGVPTIDKVPASTLYHAFLGITELTRAAPAFHGHGAAS